MAEGTLREPHDPPLQIGELCIVVHDDAVKWGGFHIDTIVRVEREVRSMDAKHYLGKSGKVFRCRETAGNRDLLMCELQLERLADISQQEVL